MKEFLRSVVLLIFELLGGAALCLLFVCIIALFMVGFSILKFIFEFVADNCGYIAFGIIILYILYSKYEKWKTK
jgi:hypothetical protein